MTDSNACPNHPPHITAPPAEYLFGARRYCYDCARFLASPSSPTPKPFTGARVVSSWRVRSGLVEVMP